MSRTIDERIVQMTFDNKNFEKNAGTTLSTLDKLKNGLNFKSANSSLETLEKTASKFSLTNIVDSVSSVTDSFSVMEIAAITAISNISNKLTNLGINLVKSLSVDQISTGWSKFNEALASQQTILSSVEGKTDANGNVYDMDAVNARIEKLRTYSDETSYSLGQMTTAIGSFTSAGIDLDVATTAIMGISNACADAGVSTQKAQSAYEGFSKAIGQGSITLGIWNQQLKTSGITNSERFKQSIIDSAEAVGNLVKKGKELYTKEGDLVNVSTFAETLNKGWATSKVVLDALSSYSDTIDGILTNTGKVDLSIDAFKGLTEEMSKQGRTIESLGLDQEFDTVSQSIKAVKKAYKELGLEVPKSINALARAQEAISLSQAIDSVKESVSSGWANTFEIIFGNYEEAKVLWTDVANDMWYWFASSGEKRNSILKAWKEMWEYDPEDSEAPVTQIIALWRDFAEVITSIKDKFGGSIAKIFGIGDDDEYFEKVASSIFNFIEKIRSSLQSLSTYFSGENARSMFTQVVLPGLEGVLKALKTIVDIGKLVGQTFSAMFGNRLKVLLTNIQFIIGFIGQSIGGIADNVNENIGSVSTTISKLMHFFSPILDFILFLSNRLVDVLKHIRNITTGVEEASGVFNVYKTVLSIFNKLFNTTVKLFESGAGVLDFVSNLISKAFEKIKSTFNSLKDTFDNVITNHGGDILGLAAIGLAVKKFFDIKWWKESIETFVGFIKDFKTVITDTIDDLQWNMESQVWANYAKVFREIAISIGILAVSLALIASIREDKLGNALGALVVIAGILTAMFKVIGMITKSGEHSKGLKEITKQITNFTAFSSLVKIAESLAIMAIGLKILSTINSDELKDALLAMGLILTSLAGFLWAVTKLNKQNLFGQSNLKVIKEIGSGMVGLGVGLIAIAAALKIMSTMKYEEVTVGLYGLGVMLAAILGLTVGISKLSSGGSFLAVATGLLILSPALILMAAAMKLMGTINIDQGNQALGLFVGILGSLAIVGVLLAKTKASLALISLAGSLAIISVALLGLSASLIILSKLDFNAVLTGVATLLFTMATIGLTAAALGTLSPLMLAFSVALVAVAGAMILVTGAMVKAAAASAAFKLFGDNFAYGFTKFVENATAAIIGVLPAMIMGIITAIINLATEIKDAIVSIITIICNAITETVPTIVDTLITVIDVVVMKSLNWLAENTQTIVENLCDILCGLIRGIAYKLDDITLALIDLFVSMIDSLTLAVNEGVPAIAESLGKLVGAIIKAIPKALAAAGKGLLASLFSNLFDEETEDVGTAQGANTGDNYIAGIESKNQEIKDAGTTAGETAADAMEDKEGAKESAINTASGFINHMMSQEVLADFSLAGMTDANAYMDAFNSTLDINSPSREMAKSAKFTVMGFLKGITENLTTIGDSGKDSAQKFIDAFKTSVDLANGTIDDGLNPVITPVIDMSQIDEQTGAINGLFGNRSVKGAIAISGIQNGGKSALAAGSNNTISVNFSVSNAGRDLTEADINKFGSMIARRVNEELGSLI